MNIKDYLKSLPEETPGREAALEEAGYFLNNGPDGFKVLVAALATDDPQVYLEDLPENTPGRDEGLAEIEYVLELNETELVLFKQALAAAPDVPDADIDYAE